MSERPTPETDAFLNRSFKHRNDELEKLYDHAKDLERKRDELREALMKIEEIFIDGEDTYLDFVRVGNIARAALEK